MSETPSSGDGGRGGDDKRRRLAEALRRNLARRKAQSRAREAEGGLRDRGDAAGKTGD